MRDDCLIDDGTTESGDWSSASLSFSNYLFLSPSPLTLSSPPTRRSCCLARSFAYRICHLTSISFFLHGNITTFTTRSDDPRSTIIDAFANASLHRARRINDHLGSCCAPYMDAYMCACAALVRERAHVSRTNAPLLASREREAHVTSQPIVRFVACVCV